MPHYLIELPHESEVTACARVVRVFLESGSHYLTNADWGCSDGVHKSWFTVEARSHDEARLVLPPSYRAEASVVELNKWSMESLDGAVRLHTGQGLDAVSR